MSRRHVNAIGIQNGAVNVGAIASTLATACADVHSEGKSPAEDPAVRLMVHQLAFLCNTAEFDRDQDAYAAAMGECQRMASTAP